MPNNILLAIDLQQLVRALCYTLLDSLWLGVIAAVMAGIVIACTVRSRASVRYNLLLVIAGAFVLTTISCFTKTYSNEPVVNLQSTGVINQASSSFPDGPSPSSVNVTTYSSWQILEQFIDRYAGVIVLCWLVLFLWKASRLIAGFYGLHQCRNKDIQITGAVWTSRVQVLAAQLGIQKVIAVLESARITVPCTIGYFKPVILVPLGMFTLLPPEQVESILLHELAHIKRKDFLTNLLLEFVEAVFFFNPPIYWLLSVIRQEREVCCDAMVTASHGEARHYMDALVSFQERFNEAAYAMPLLGKHSSLFDRIKTMISKKNKNLNSMEKVLLSLSIVAVISLAFVPANSTITDANKSAGAGQSAIAAHVFSIAQQVPEIPVSESVTAPIVEAIVNTNSDTTKQPVDTIESVRNYMKASPEKRTDYYEIRVTSGNLYKIVMEKGEVVSFSLNGIERGVKEAVPFTALIKKIQAQAAAAEEQRGKAEKERRLAEQVRKEAHTAAATADQERNSMAQKRIFIEQNRKEIENKRIEIEAQRTKMEQEKKKIEQQRKEIEKQHQFSIERRKEFKIHDSLTSIHKQHVRDIINLLVKSGVVKDAGSVQWFALTHGAFIVNGQTQDAAMHQRLVKSYDIQSKLGLYYGDVPGNATGYFFGKHEIMLSK